MTDQDLFETVGNFLALVFCVSEFDGGCPGDWSSSGFKPCLFTIFKNAFDSGLRINGQALSEFLTLEWIWFDGLSETEQQQIHRMCHVWGEWLYACERISQ